MNTSKRKNIAILSFALIVVMLGYGMVIPLFPFYVAEMGAGGQQLGLLIAISALLELLCSPLWGSLSDRVGRKPILPARRTSWPSDKSRSPSTISSTWSWR